MQFRNGAYLFKPDLNHQPPILPIIDPIDNLKEVVIISGHVFSEISLIYEAGTSVTIQGLNFIYTYFHRMLKRNPKSDFCFLKIVIVFVVFCFFVSIFSKNYALLIYEAGTSVTIQGQIFNIFSPHAFTKNEIPDHRFLVYQFFFSSYVY